MTQAAVRCQLLPEKAGPSMEITGEDIGYEGQSCEGRSVEDYVEKNETVAECG